MTDRESYCELVRARVGEVLFALSADGESLPVATLEQTCDTIDGLARTISYLLALRNLEHGDVDLQAMVAAIAADIGRLATEIEESFPTTAIN